jgi:hypothetical protein
MRSSCCKTVLLSESLTLSVVLRVYDSAVSSYPKVNYSEHQLFFSYLSRLLANKLLGATSGPVLILHLWTDGKFVFCSAFTAGPGIAQCSDRLRARWPRNLGSIPGRGMFFCPLRGIQTGWSTHQASGTEDTYRLVSLEVNWPGREAGHSPASIAEAKNVGSIPPLRYTPSWRRS